MSDDFTLEQIEQFKAATDRIMLAHADRVCCMGAAARGVEWCTCWRAVPDEVQCAPQLGAAIPLRDKMCDDCAFRPDSPEMQGHDDRIMPGPNGMRVRELKASPAKGIPFFCHKGFMTSSVARHEITGEERPHGRYIPPIIEVDGTKIPFGVDGQPSAVCGGWLHLRRQYIANMCQTPEEE